MRFATQVTVIKYKPNYSKGTYDIENIQTMLGIRSAYSLEEAEDSVLKKTAEVFPEHEFFSVKTLRCY